MCSNKGKFKNYLEYMFGANSLAQRRVLDVGGELGLSTFYAAVNGAQAVCLGLNLMEVQPEWLSNFRLLSNCSPWQG